MRLFVLTGQPHPDVMMVDEQAIENEISFEAHVLQCLSQLFPKHKCFVFTGSFILENSIRRPDLALVAQDFSHWFVIEVELLTHSLHKHVLPQMRTIRYGDPQADCLQNLCRGMLIPWEVARTVLERVPRSTAVIANGFDPEWAASLRAIQVQYLSVCPFRSETNVSGFDILGELEVIDRSLGFGIFEATLSMIRMPPNTDLEEGVIQVQAVDRSVSEWTITKTDEAVWLFKKRGKLALLNGCYVQLVRSFSGDLIIRCT